MPRARSSSDELGRLEGQLATLAALEPGLLAAYEKFHADEWGRVSAEGSRLRPHLASLHTTCREAIAQAATYRAEASALRSLPPPPPVGTEELAAMATELEDSRARLEVARRQLGALVHEKGVLNGELRRREQDMASLSEEKTKIVGALTSALKRVAAEKDAALSGKASGSPPETAREQQLAVMVSSQKRSIEGLRRELHQLRRSAADASAAAGGGAGEGGGGSEEASADAMAAPGEGTSLADGRALAAGGAAAAGGLGGGSAAACAAGSSPGGAAGAAGASLADHRALQTREARLRHEVETLREQMSMALLHFQSDRSSMTTQLAVLRSQLGDANAQVEALRAELQQQRDRTRAAAESARRSARMHERSDGQGGRHADGGSVTVEIPAGSGGGGGGGGGGLTSVLGKRLRATANTISAPARGAWRVVLWLTVGVAPSRSTSHQLMSV